MNSESDTVASKPAEPESAIFAEMFFEQAVFDAEASEHDMASPTACRGKLDDS